MISDKFSSDLLITFHLSLITCSELFVITNTLPILLDKFFGRKCAVGKTRTSDCAFKPIDFILSHADRGYPFAERLDRQISAEFELSVDIMPHFPAVENERDREPSSERVFEIFGKKRQTIFAGFDKSINKPFISDKPRFE